MLKFHENKLEDLLNPADDTLEFRIREDACLYNENIEALGGLLDKIAGLSDENGTAPSIGLLLLAPASMSDGKSSRICWEVLDGHQLIVTLFLLLKYLNLPAFI